jgi:hypothetical protein
MSVVLNTIVPSSVLKKKNNAIGYHRVREAIAARIIRFAYIKSGENVSDVLTKPLSNEKFHYLMKRWYSKSSFVHCQCNDLLIQFVYNLIRK